jgi:hypothetical protein
MEAMMIEENKARGAVRQQPRQMRAHLTVLRAETCRSETSKSAEIKNPHRRREEVGDSAMPSCQYD